MTAGQPVSPGHSRKARTGSWLLPHSRGARRRADGGRRGLDCAAVTPPPSPFPASPRGPGARAGRRAGQATRPPPPVPRAAAGPARRSGPQVSEAYASAALLAALRGRRHLAAASVQCMTPEDIAAFRTAARYLVELGAARLRDLDPAAVPPGFTACWTCLTTPAGTACTSPSCREGA